MKKIGNFVWGALLIAVGVIWALNVLGVTHVHFFFPGWWTLFIIVPCAIGVLTEEDKVGSLVGVGIGVLLLLGCLGVIEFSVIWGMILPVLLVILGVGLICRAGYNSDKVREIHKRHMEERREAARSEYRESTKGIREGEVVEEGGASDRDEDEEDDDDDEDEDDDDDDSDFVEHWAVFGQQKLDFKGKEYVDSRIEAIFGGVTLDLRGAKMAKESVVKVTSVFGGAKIYVPEDVEVELSSKAIVGGVENKRKKMDKDAKKKLYIDATCVFGGVEIF